MYRENILENYKTPKNFEKLKNKPTNTGKGFNASCGDELQVELIIEKNKIKEISFSGKGCAISIASASLLSEKVKNMDVEKVKNMDKEDLLKLLEIPISPIRLKCALLSLETIHKAIQNK